MGKFNQLGLCPQRASSQPPGSCWPDPEDTRVPQGSSSWGVFCHTRTLQPKGPLVLGCGLVRVRDGGRFPHRLPGGEHSRSSCHPLLVPPDFPARAVYGSVHKRFRVPPGVTHSFTHLQREYFFFC